jgi:hypothetical protein
VPFSFCIRKAECLASSSQASSQFIRPDSNESLEILRIPVLHLVTQANNLIAFENIYWASFEAMKRKRLNAMPALLKFLVLLAIFLSASYSHAFTSMSPVAEIQARVNHLFDLRNQ